MPARGGAFPAASRGVPWEIRHSPPCVVFDSEPAASPPACESCGVLAAASQTVTCVCLAVRGLR